MTEHPKGWVVRRIEEAAEGCGGIQKGPHRAPGANAARYLTVAHVQRNRILTGDPRYFQVSAGEFDRWRLLPGDVLIVEGNGSPEEIGRTALFRGEISDCVYQNHLIRVRPNPSLLNSEFLNAYLNSSIGRAAVKAQSSTSSGLRTLSVGRIRQIPVPCPPIAEQARLSKVIGTWDEAIGIGELRLGAAVRRKRGLMQQMLTGRRRFKEFKGERWRTWRLGDLFKERVEIGRTDLPLVAITGQNGVVPRDTLEKRDTSSEDKSKYLRIAPGDIGYNTMRMWQGVAGLSKIEGIVSPAYTICIPNERIHARFAAYLFKHAPMINLFRRYSQGLVDDTLSLKFPSFAEIHLTIPGVPEQRRIAAVLETCDGEIELLEKQLAALKEQKRGLMQKLLTGEVRLKG